MKLRSSFLALLFLFSNVNFETKAEKVEDAIGAFFFGMALIPVSVHFIKKGINAKKLGEKLMNTENPKQYFDYMKKFTANHHIQLQHDSFYDINLYLTLMKNKDNIEELKNISYYIGNLTKKDANIDLFIGSVAGAYGSLALLASIAIMASNK